MELYHKNVTEKPIRTRRADFIFEGKVLVEIKNKPFDLFFIL